MRVHLLVNIKQAAIPAELTNKSSQVKSKKNNNQKKYRQGHGLCFTDRHLRSPFNAYREPEEKIGNQTATNDTVIIVINLGVPAILNLRQEK